MLNRFSFIAFIVTLFVISCAEDCGCDYEFNIIYEYVEEPQEEPIKEPVKQIIEEPSEEPQEQIVEEPQEQIECDVIDHANAMSLDTCTVESCESGYKISKDRKSCIDLSTCDNNTYTWDKGWCNGIYDVKTFIYIGHHWICKDFSIDTKVECDTSCDCPSDNSCVDGTCWKLKG